MPFRAEWGPWVKGAGRGLGLACWWTVSLLPTSAAFICLFHKTGHRWSTVERTAREHINDANGARLPWMGTWGDRRLGRQEPGGARAWGMKIWEGH